MDFARARRFMLDGQLRPNQVQDPRILAAFGELAREAFLPPDLAPRAYADADVPLPGGRFLMQPMVMARLFQLAELRRGDRTLVLGAGCGYGAAILASMGANVTALENDPSLLGLAQSGLARCLPEASVRLLREDPAHPPAGLGPFDVIVIEGGVPAIPRPIETLLAEGGRLVALVTAGGPPARARLVRHIGGSFTPRTAFEAHAAPLPAFQPSASFAF
ncbi:MAG: protein-L-isoaspartate O-methyltransferase [Roseomonas sp.]|nr:protein-L-isoaspartate O-methyltransferase [Roseomonas sp.]MCA3329153.1 protein-L-isoaspartate O-methyltransferase [Roseomonas sp.]MCA3332067.1 protein-L-isoaspartate O-methyltransferase [Roseomonas sp.]MCA3334715.1 protein-L-isoaspartate O-methyltransferase [Roseomonas sp.]MCA3347075.1 protein-L-isoaspartate O-methyltransferase [Roseomonas sp.]